MIKTTLDGRELMIILHPSECGAYEKEDAFKPTETIKGANGDIYITDGYDSQYVLRYTKEVEFIRKIGNGRGTGTDQFQNTRGVCIDERDKNRPTLLVTSRASNRFKRFSLDGNYLGEISLPGAFMRRTVIHEKSLYVGVCWSSKVDFVEGNMDTHPKSNNPNSGFVTSLDENNIVVSNSGGTVPEYQKGELQRILQ